MITLDEYKQIARVYIDSNPTATKEQVDAYMNEYMLNLTYPTVEKQDDLQTKNVEAKPKARKSKAADKPVFIEQPTVAVASYEEPLSVQSSDHSSDGDRRGQ